MGEVKEDPRVLAMLRKLASEGGAADASDYPEDPLRPWYDDRGMRDDTFNVAIKAGLIRVAHDCDTSTSTARITEAGRAALSPHKEAGHGG